MRDRKCWSNIPAGPCRRIGTRGSRWSCGLAGRNVLPKYGFPVDVVGLNVVQTGSTAENEIDLTRDLSLAIVDYAPGHSVVAAKKLWTSKGINIPRDRAAFTFAWAKCECGAFRRGLEHVAVTCSVCESAAVSARGTFLVPVHGFVEAVDTKKGPGDDRPPRSARVIREFGSFKGDLPDFEHVPGLRRDSRMRTSRQGRITIINTGQQQVAATDCVDSAERRSPRRHSLQPHHRRRPKARVGRVPHRLIRTCERVGRAKGR